MDDFKKLLYGVLVGFALLIVGFVSFAFIWSCGLDFSCKQASPPPVGTPIPTLIPATLPAPLTFVPMPTPNLVAADAGTPTAGDISNVARPSNPGGPGEAVNLTGDAAAGAQVFSANCVPCHGAQGVGGISNPGSADGTVPALNPIDPTLKDADQKIFAFNLALFLQHGSTPAGLAPTFSMPAWGDLAALTQQQIADVIAYLISLNP
jgi:mono/diheme cytochrome c family protein